MSNPIYKKQYVYSKSKIGMLRIMYRSQEASSVRRKHSAPEYTVEEFITTILAMPLFHTLHEKWTASGYKRKLAPSIDRLDDYLPYTKTNIQLGTWEENDSKHRKDRKEGRNNKISNKVGQYSKEGILLHTYHSNHEAARVTGINRGNISACCREERKTTGGYVWKHIVP